MIRVLTMRLGQCLGAIEAIVEVRVHVVRLVASTVQNEPVLPGKRP